MRVYQSRVEMLSEVARGGKCCEVGVFAGDFAKAILCECRPASLVLIDTFTETMFSCDEHGGNPRTISGSDALLAAVGMRASNPAVEVIKSLSSEGIPRLDDDMDFIYIDADHSFEGCAADLESAWGKVKPGGLLGGHDYSLNEERAVDTSHYAGFGVKAAVDGFCLSRGVELHAIAMDGYTSFLIRKPA